MSLAATLFPEYRRRVLGLLLLHPGQRYHLREIARLTGTVPGTLTRELAKLTEAELLVKESVGRQTFYRANRQSPIFDELASIIRKTSGLAEVLADALRPLAERIEAAFVYGSAASGKTRSDSDIDLLVIGDVAFGEVAAAIFPAQETLGREINPKVYLPEEWRQALAAKGGFVTDVMAKPRIRVMGVMDDIEKS